VTNATLNSTTNSTTSPGSVRAGIGWMVLLEVLLFWIPVAGSLIAGFVGGRKSGGVGNAVTAAFLPVLILCIVLSFLANPISKIPLVGALAGWGGFEFSVTHAFPMLFGAVVGGLSADDSRARARAAGGLPPR
jgi:hypothetical protein